MEAEYGTKNVNGFAMEADGTLVAGQTIGLRPVTAKDNRRFVEAVLWIARTGSPWRDMPKAFGHWHRIYVRYSRWSKKGIWKKVFEELADPDLEYLMVDGSIVRGHQHGASKKVNVTNKPKQFAWRIEYQNSCSGRCVRQSDAADYHARPGIGIRPG